MCILKDREKDETFSDDHLLHGLALYVPKSICLLPCDFRVPSHHCGVGFRSLPVTGLAYCTTSIYWVPCEWLYIESVFY